MCTKSTAFLLEGIEGFQHLINQITLFNLDYAIVQL